MNLDTVDLTKLTGIMTASVIDVLGGSVGNDYASWTDDIVQDALVSLLEHEGEVEDVYNFGKVVAIRRALSFQNKEERRREIEQEHGAEINRELTGQSAELLAADPLEILAYEEMRDRLDSLSPLLYNTTSRHYIDGRSIIDIAEEDGVSEDVIYKRLERARTLIRDEQPDETRSSDWEPATDGIPQQTERFTTRDRAWLCRQARLITPDLTLTEWKNNYG